MQNTNVKLAILSLASFVDFTILLIIKPALSTVVILLSLILIITSLFLKNNLLDYNFQKFYEFPATFLDIQKIEYFLNNHVHFVHAWFNIKSILNNEMNLTITRYTHLKPKPCAKDRGSAFFTVTPLYCDEGGSLSGPSI